MNFFKSIILDDPEPPKTESEHEPSPDSPVNPPEEDPKPNVADQGGNRWSFVSLVKTISTRSESVIETYSRDLMEFGSGLRKETEIIRDVASRAVKDLPASLEAGTSAAHGVLDGVLKSTAEIISKEMQVSASDGEAETPETNRSLNSGRYSWFEAQLSGIQSDLNTFCEEPEDAEYEKWKSKFSLAEKQGEIDGLIGENGVLDAIFGKVVPSVVDHDTFWCRYFYRVDKLQQQEKVRANLVKRAISADEDEDELSWDVDDDDYEKDGEKLKGGDGLEGDASNGYSNLAEKLETSSGQSQPEKEGSNASVDDGVKNNLVELSDRDAALDEKETATDEIAGIKSDDKLKSEESIKGKNNENVGVDKDETREVSAVSSHEVNTEEEDMGWDEIGDIGSEDEKKVSTSSHGERQNREELRKQLHAAEDDEDLSWDIEDDDEPVKS